MRDFFGDPPNGGLLCYLHIISLVRHFCHQYRRRTVPVSYKYQRQAGFTIVELLIVIVVIAILAAISIVAYNGIQQRAHNAKTLVLVNQWEKTIRVHQARSGLLPEDWTCLGRSADEFEAIPSEQIGTGQCERNIIVIDPSPDWTSELKTVPTPGQTQPTAAILAASATPSPGLLPMQRAGSNGYIRGIIYAVIFDPDQAPNGQPGAYIFYALKGEECTPSRAYRVINNLHVCSARLTTDNYASEIFQP